MPAPLTAAKRAAILAAVEAAADGTDERSAGAIAREHGVARSTVTRIARDADLGHAWQRTQTERAAAAATVDNRARRAALSSGLLDDVAALRARFLGRYRYVAAGRNGIESLELDEPPADAVRNYVTAAAVLIDKHVALEKVDSDDGVGAALSMMGKIAAAIDEAAHQQTDPDGGP